MKAIANQKRSDRKAIMKRIYSEDDAINFSDCVKFTSFCLSRSVTPIRPMHRQTRRSSESDANSHLSACFTSSSDLLFLLIFPPSSFFIIYLYFPSSIFHLFPHLLLKSSILHLLPSSTLFVITATHSLTSFSSFLILHPPPSSIFFHPLPHPFTRQQGSITGYTLGDTGYEPPIKDTLPNHGHGEPMVSVRHQLLTYLAERGCTNIFVANQVINGSDQVSEEQMCGVCILIYRIVDEFVESGMMNREIK
jgi:hypothetical protein